MQHARVANVRFDRQHRRDNRRNDRAPRSSAPGRPLAPTFAAAPRAAFPTGRCRRRTPSERRERGSFSDRQVLLTAIAGISSNPNFFIWQAHASRTIFNQICIIQSRFSLVGSVGFKLMACSSHVLLKEFLAGRPQRTLLGPQRWYCRGWMS